MWVAASVVWHLLRMTFNIQWVWHTDHTAIHTGRGGRRGTAEMPPLKEVYLDHAILICLKRGAGSWPQARLGAP